MKVVQISNYNLDYYVEKQSSFSSLTHKQAHDECAMLTNPLPADGPDWYIVVEDGYVLSDRDPNS